MLIEECDGVNGLLLIGNVIEDGLWLPEGIDSLIEIAFIRAKFFFFFFLFFFFYDILKMFDYPHYALAFRAKFVSIRKIIIFV